MIQTPIFAIAAFALVALGIVAGAGESRFVGTVILVAGLVIATVSPTGAAVFTLAMTPFAFHLHAMPGGRFSLLELGIIWTVAGASLRSMVPPAALIRRASYLVTRYPTIVVTAVVMIAATAIAFITMPAGAMEAEALREVRLVIVEPIAFALVLLLVVRSDGGRHWLVAGIATGGILASIGAGAQLFGFGNGVVADGVTRLTGPYSHPNNLALFLERVVLLVLPSVFFLRRTWRAVAIAATLLMAAALLLTFSRGGWLAFCTGGIVVLVLLRRVRWVVFGVLALVVASVPMLALFRDRIFDLGGTGDEPTRFAIWRSSWRMIADHPWTGVGPDQFLYQYGRRYVEPAGWAERYTSHPHNAVLDFWVRLGVGGLVAFGLLIMAAAQAAWRHARTIRTDWIRLGALASLIAAIVHGMIDNLYFLPDLALLTWTLIVLLWLDPDMEYQDDASW